MFSLSLLTSGKLSLLVCRYSTLENQLKKLLAEFYKGRRHRQSPERRRRRSKDIRAERSRPSLATVPSRSRRSPDNMQRRRAARWS
jgi:hypothetical protein